MLQVEDYISKIGEYFEGIERYNDALIVRVKLPERWGVYPSSDERIKVTPSEEVPNEYYYYGSSNDVNLEDIFQTKTHILMRFLELNSKVITSMQNEFREDIENESKDESRQRICERNQE